MEGFLLTLSLWGVFGVFVGLFMGGIGVVPIAMFATSVKGQWMPLIELVVLAVMTFASRIGATTLAASLENERQWPIRTICSVVNLVTLAIASLAPRWRSERAHRHEAAQLLMHRTARALKNW